MVKPFVTQVGYIQFRNLAFTIIFLLFSKQTKLKSVSIELSSFYFQRLQLLPFIDTDPPPLEEETFDPRNAPRGNTRDLL